MQETSWLVSFLAATVVAGTPLLLAALGEMLAERTGILNLGVEGMMIFGAVSGFGVANSTGSLFLGVLASLLAGGVMALIHALICVNFKGNQVVSGLALTILGTGLAGFAGKSFVGLPLPIKFVPIPIPGLAELPVLGPVLFRQDVLVYLSLLLAVFIFLFLFKTSYGLSWRAVGEDPAAADAAGIEVGLIRYLGTISGGMLAGLAGAYLSLAYAPSWMENLTAGRGWIAVALVIFGMWHPFKVLGGAYLFGGIEALTFRLQARGVGVSPFFLQMLPYLATVVILCWATLANRQKAGPPKALGLPYDRESN